MKRSLRTLEQLHASLSSSGDGTDASARALEERRAKEAARVRQLAKLSPYRNAEYRCLECVGALRQSLKDIEELQFTLQGEVPTSSESSRRDSLSREERAAAEEDHPEAEADNDGDSQLCDERAQLLGGGPQRRRRPQHPARRSGEAALLEQELLRTRQRARRAYQQLQNLQREAARLAAAASSRAAATSDAGIPPAEASTAAAAAGPSSASPSPPPAHSSTAAMEVLDWQRTSLHVERAKQWYRDVFGIHVVSSSADPSTSSSLLQLNRPSQPHQHPGSMAFFGSGANPTPAGVAASLTSASSASEPLTSRPGRSGAPHGGDESYQPGSSDTPPPATTTQALQLRSAREDAEFQEFFASVQVNDALMDAAMDRLSEGLARLLDNARGIQDELAVQEDLLQGTETRINENEAELVSMNRRLRRAIRDMEDSSICMYVVCLLLLLLILGVLLRVAR